MHPGDPHENDRPVVRVDRPAGHGLDEPSDAPAMAGGPSQRATRRPTAPREPLRLSRIGLTLLLLLALGGGIGVAELRQQQGARTEADRRGSVLVLGAVLLDQSLDRETVVLRTQVQNRGPEAVRVLAVTVPGSTFAIDRPDPEGELLEAGADLTVSVQAPLGCSDAGSSLEPARPLVLAVTAETSRGGKRTAQVPTTAPPLVQAFTDLSRRGLDRVCGVVPAEEALLAYALPSDDEDGARLEGSHAFAVQLALANVTRSPQRVVSIDSPLGATTVEQDGKPLPLPFTVPTGTFPVGGSNSPGHSILEATVVVACGSSRVTGPDNTVYVSFDASPGTPRQRTEVDGSSFGRC